MTKELKIIHFASKQVVVKIVYCRPSLGQLDNLTFVKYMGKYMGKYRHWRSSKIGIIKLVHQYGFMFNVSPAIWAVHVQVKFSSVFNNCLVSFVSMSLL